MSEEKIYTSRSVFNVNNNNLIGNNLNRQQHYNQFNFRRVFVKPPPERGGGGGGEGGGGAYGQIGQHTELPFNNNRNQIGGVNNTAAGPINGVDSWSSMRPIIKPDIYIMSKKRAEPPAPAPHTSRRREDGNYYNNNNYRKNETNGGGGKAQVPNNELTPQDKLLDINNWIDVSESATDQVKSQNRLKNLQSMSSDHGCYLSVLLGKKFENDDFNRGRNLVARRDLVAINVAQQLPSTHSQPTRVSSIQNNNSNNTNNDVVVSMPRLMRPSQPPCFPRPPLAADPRGSNGKQPPQTNASYHTNMPRINESSRAMDTSAVALLNTTNIESNLTVVYNERYVSRKNRSKPPPPLMANRSNRNNSKLADEENSPSVSEERRRVERKSSTQIMNMIPDPRLNESSISEAYQSRYQPVVKLKKESVVMSSSKVFDNKKEVNAVSRDHRQQQQQQSRVKIGMESAVVSQTEMKQNNCRRGGGEIPQLGKHQFENYSKHLNNLYNDRKIGNQSSAMMMVMARASMSNMSDGGGANLSYEVKSRQMLLNESLLDEISSPTPPQHQPNSNPNPNPYANRELMNYLDVDDLKSDMQQRSLSEFASLAKNVRLKYTKCSGQAVARVANFSNFNGTQQN